MPLVLIDRTRETGKEQCIIFGKKRYTEFDNQPKQPLAK